MTTTTPSAEQRVLTPTVSRVVRRSLFWVGVGVVALVIALVVLSVRGSSEGGDPLSSTNASPSGAMAVAEVLRQQGVEVVAASTLEQATAAVSDPASTTLFVYDSSGFLNSEQWAQISTLADNVVLADPTFAQLREIAPGVAQAGRVSTELTADCDIPALSKATTISGDATGFRVIDEGSDAFTCLSSGDDVYSLVQVQHDSTTVTVLGATGALTNESAALDDNAAFALTLLGGSDTLVWYLPSFADVNEDNPPTLGELSPAWVTPALVMLILTFIAAAFWRGRRFGPLVVENLPVTVKASETMLGRARLYEKSSSRLRALDSLRIGSIQRLAVACGLPRLATVDEVIGAVAAITGRQVADIRALLIDAIPSTDRDLVELSDALLSLEHAVSAAIRS